MKKKDENIKAGESRREVLKRMGKFLIPTFLNFQVASLEFEAYGTLGRPPGAPS